MRTSNKSIVIADDDEDDIELFKSMALQFCPDLNIDTVENGDKLMHLLEHSSVPNIIVLDLNMPYKSGKEWLDEIRSFKQYDQVPIVILSGHKNPSYIDHCLSHGADKYYIKPATLPAIKSMIAEICGITKGIIRDL